MGEFLSNILMIVVVVGFFVIGVKIGGNFRKGKK